MYFCNIPRRYGCGQWCVATSEDGLVFSTTTLQYSRYGASDSTDGTSCRSHAERIAMDNTRLQAPEFSLMATAQAT